MYRKRRLGQSITIDLVEFPGHGRGVELQFISGGGVGNREKIAEDRPVFDAVDEVNFVDFDSPRAPFEFMGSDDPFVEGGQDFDWLVNSCVHNSNQE